MIMGARNFNNTRALFAICLYSALLIGAETGTLCHRDEYYERIGCTLVYPLYSTCLDKQYDCWCKYNCNNLKDSLTSKRDARRVTCLVNGKAYREGEYFELQSPDGSLKCLCSEDFHDLGQCLPGGSGGSLSSFVSAVQNHVDEIWKRAEFKLIGSSN